MTSKTTIAVVGLGYVGLPLAVEFGKKCPTIGFDLSQAKVDAYRRFVDPTGEVAPDELKAAKFLSVTTDPTALTQADFIVVAVPTPIDDAHQPDFGPLLGASEAVGRNLKRGTTVVFESTVYPGATEEICVPVIEKHSGMKWREDFFVGYSPERINPGDHEHTLVRITKVVSGDGPDTLERVASVYESIITAGVHRASSIKVAEAAKVIENTQRDLNIALMNELALIFHRIGIDTLEVLETAGTKWNFLPFRPGLVGGHCIGVDPYYLTHKADMLGYHPQVILAGRRINDGMGKYIADETVKHLIQAGCHVKGSHVNVLGLTFKENCPDLRNSRVIDVVRELASFGINVHVHDPVAERGGGASRIRRHARAVGAVAACRRHRRSGRASRISRASDRRFRGEGDGERSVCGRQMPGRRRRAAGPRHRGVEIVMATVGSLPERVGRRARDAARAAVALARHGQRRLHRLPPAGGVAAARPGGCESRQFRYGVSAQSRRSTGGRGRRRMATAHIPRSGHRRSRCVPAGVRRRRHRAPRGGARLGAAVDRRSVANSCRQRHRIPQHAGRGPRRRRGAVRIRRIEFDLWRPSGAAQGRRQHRAPAVAVRSDEARR